MLIQNSMNIKLKKLEDDLDVSEVAKEYFE